MIKFKFDLLIDETSADVEEKLFHVLNRIVERLPPCVTTPVLAGLLAQDLCTAVATDGQPDDLVDRVLAVVKQEAEEAIALFRKTKVN